jgi:hypothetical protein
MWEFNYKEITSSEFFPEDTIGFIYCIYNITKGKKYIGKKNIGAWKVVSEKNYNESKEKGLTVARHKNKSQSVKGEPVWVYKVRAVSNWVKYCGSNAELQEDIKNGDKIKKVILFTANCTKQLTFLEMETQVKMDVLRKPEEYYNQNILGKFWPNDLNC